VTSRDVKYAIERGFFSCRTSAYGRRHVATGPYMIRNDAGGALTGYRPNRRLELVRNPNWAPETDFRPAHLDAIDIRMGREDTTAATREVLRGRAALGRLRPCRQRAAP
jgi:peptide/nickel transport system substrate-binding protein